MLIIDLVSPPVAQQRAGVEVSYSIIKVQNGDNHIANIDCYDVLALVSTRFCSTY